MATFISISFYNVAYVYPVYGAGAWTHDLLVMNHLP